MLTHQNSRPQPAVKNQAQENLPELEQDEERAEPFPFPEDEPESEKVEIRGSTSLFPHERQTTLSLSPLERQRDSKTFPHFLHLNS
jgi:hypothetical protein